MRKKLILLTCVLLCLTLFVGVLVACDPDSAEDGTQTPGDATKPGDITTPGGDEQGGTTTPDDDTTIPDDDTTTPEETEEGAWWAYGETEPIMGTIIGKGIVRFVSDTQWEMEVMEDCMYGSMSSGSAETKYGRMWCTGEYEFVGEPGESVLRMRIVPDMPYLESGAILEPTNVRICGADGGIVLNDEWVEYTPDETGVYNIKITIHSSQAEGQISSEQGTISFHFMAPNFDIEPGYYYDDEQEYLSSLESGVPDEPIQEEAYIEASVVAAIAAAADKAIKNVHASEPWQMMIYAFDNSDLEYIADYGLYDPEDPTPGVIAGGFVNADSYSEVEGQEGYSGDECVYFMAYETAEQANAAGISHFGKGAWASVLPAPGAYADKVVRVVGNCVLVAPSDEVLDAFLAGGEKQTEGFIAVCMQIMQSVKEDLACAEMSVGRGSGECTVYVQSTVNPQYSSEFKTLQAEYFVDEQERAEALAYFEELVADRSHFGEGSSAWEEAGFACMYGVCPEPGLYFQVSEDGTYARASYYIYDSPDPVTVTVPAEWNGSPVTYMSGTFIGAKPVKEVILPDTLKTIGYESFADSGLQRITIPASVTEIDMDAFRGCTNLEEIHIEEGSPLDTDSIWRDAFADTAWYAAQPDGPLYIDGILVGYKN